MAFDDDSEASRVVRRLTLSLSALWARAASRHLVRAIGVPIGARVITIGGATLGGSSKTPLAIACVAALAASGARVALVGHAYRARPRCARVVGEADGLHEVGDEALLASRALALLHPDGRAKVVVAPRRAEAVELAARHADVLVIDGVAQTKPLRAWLALLAVDSAEPWGRAGALPPRGDSRAPVAGLLSVCDAVVAVGDVGVPSRVGGALQAHVLSEGAFLDGKFLTWADLRGARVGLVSALARPERVVRSLGRRGITIRATLAACDHGPISARLLARARREPVDLWLATPKCALHVEARGQRLRPPFSTLAPFATIEHALVLSRELKERLCVTAVS